jgi:hypothetical protein
VTYTVGKLKEILAQLPDNTKVTFYSDSTQNWEEDGNVCIFTVINDTVPSLGLGPAIKEKKHK